MLQAIFKILFYCAAIKFTCNKAETHGLIFLRVAQTCTVFGIYRTFEVYDTYTVVVWLHTPIT